MQLHVRASNLTQSTFYFRNIHQPGYLNVKGNYVLIYPDTNEI